LSYQLGFDRSSFFFNLSSSFDIKVYNWITKIYFVVKHVCSLLTLFFFYYYYERNWIDS
jgi:hypothetical protein